MRIYAVVKYRNAEKEEYCEFTDLINYMFRVDFEKVLPKTFNENYDFHNITKVAQELLLGHTGRYMDIDVPGDWFPLPLFWYRVDQY